MNKLPQIVDKKHGERMNTIAVTLLQKLYQEATPPLDFIKFANGVRSGKKCPRYWYKKHKLSPQKYEKIVEQVYKELKVSRSTQSKMAIVLLAYAPMYDNLVVDFDMSVSC